MMTKMEEADCDIYPSKAVILAKGGKKASSGSESGSEMEIELALEKERDVKKMFAEITTSVSPYTSVASSDMSKESNDSGFSLTDAKYFVFSKLEQRKWQYALLGFILGLMILIATLAGSSASGGDSKRTPFLVFFQSQSPTLSPTMYPTLSPSMAPTNLPSESPSQAPSAYDPPIKDPIQLRLYWESGYFWQESIEETYWCTECVDCPEYRIGDGIGPDFKQNCTSPGDTTASCRAGNQVWVQSCKNRTKDYRFEFIHNVNSGFQIRAFNTSLCFSTVQNRFLELRPCDKYRSSQLFNPIQKTAKFELRPYEQRDLPMDEAFCLSQFHHPKANEMVGLHPCAGNVNDTTNYWEQYP